MVQAGTFGRRTPSQTQMTTVRLLLGIVLLATAATPAAAQDGGRRDRHRSAPHIRVGGSYSLAEGSTLRGPLIVIGGSARINGTVEDDIVTVGGNIELGPRATVFGDVRAVGGRIVADPAAQVRGDVDEVTAHWSSVWTEAANIGQGAWAWIAAWLTIVRLSLAFVAGLLLTAAAPGWLFSIGRRTAEEPGWSLLAGVATQVVCPPAIALLVVALVITIVGIPLLAAVPVLLAVLAALWVAGFAAAAARLGQALRGRGAPSVPRTGAALAQAPSGLDYVAGFLVLTGLTLIAQVLGNASAMLGWLSAPLASAGFVIEYVAWTIGLGAALLTAFDRRSHAVPPPLPPLNRSVVSATP
jgi:hypothetical protein